MKETSGTGSGVHNRAENKVGKKTCAGAMVAGTDVAPKKKIPKVSRKPGEQEQY